MSKRTPQGAGQSSNSDGNEAKPWFKIVTALALFAGCSLLLHQVLIEVLRRQTCPRIKPEKRRWPIDDEPWFRKAIDRVYALVEKIQQYMNRKEEEMLKEIPKEDADDACCYRLPECTDD